MKKKTIIIIICIIILLLGISIIIINKIINNNKENNYQKDNSNIDDIIYNEKDFDLKLIKIVNSINKNNYLISPYSIEIALNMLKEGANNNTRKEIENVIGARKINDVIIKDHIGVANALFIKDDYKSYVIKNYLNISDSKYNSEILYDEFKTPDVINNWVNNKTNGMIDKILDKIDENFVLGLANALTIDVEWNSPFSCKSTKEDTFNKIDGTTIKTEMMHNTLESKGNYYLKDDNATGVIMPYRKYNPETGKLDYDNGKNLDFIAILPNDNIDDYINNLNIDILNSLFNNRREVGDSFEINVSLPRFKYDYNLDSFKDVLITMGIKEAFDPNNADFTNMLPKSDKYGNIYVEEAIHKTHIDLNEKGTKAAAVTYFGMFKNTAMPQEKEKVSIKFDKPFIYMIKDHNTKEMLFFGVVHEPNEWHGTTCEDEE